jgi:hypothetical protein
MTERRPRTESELVELVRSIDAPAPDSLHRQVESLVAAPPARRRAGARDGARALGAPWGFAAAGGLGAAAVAIAIVASVGGSTSGLSIRQASALTLGPATAAAPRESHSNREQLAAGVDGVPFPYWEGRLGWRSTGARTDHLAGRTVTTVFYGDARGRQVGYAIVAGTPAPRLSGGVIARREGISFRLLQENGSAVVSWLRSGHLCVVSGRGVSSATLLALASSGARRPLTS